jgi:lysine 6-dehydrogenase
MTRIVVLGGGMVGAVIADDLAREAAFEVTVADVREGALERARARNPRVRGARADLSDPSAVRHLAEGADVVCGALSSALGFQSLRAVIEAGKPYADISFMPEDAWELDALARERGAPCIVDAGVAPGLSNLLAGRAAARLQPCERLRILVGGLPRLRIKPFEYKAGFAPSDVVEEYVRPSRIVEHGQLVVREALTEVELVDIAGLGTLEAFNTDGLRSLAVSLPVPHMVEKTMRYPGHADLMRAFREAGLFSKEEVVVAGGARVRPLDVTSAVLFPKWTYAEGEEDLTALRVEAEGLERGRRVRIVYELLDFYSQRERATSMSRTTALPCALFARMLASGRWTRPGVVAPEALGADEALTREVLHGLAARGVEVVEREAPLD